LRGRLWLQRSTKTTDIKKVILLSSTSPLARESMCGETAIYELLVKTLTPLYNSLTQISLQNVKFRQFEAVFSVITSPVGYHWQYTVGHKKTCHFYFFDNSGKYWRIFI